MNKKIFAIGVGLMMIGIIAGAYAMWNFTPLLLERQGFRIVSLHASIVHMRIRIWQHKGLANERLILDEYHAGAVTNEGDNMTLFWIFGDSDMMIGTLADYTLNATYISIGNDTGSLGTSSTQLPNEWHREAGTIEDETQSQINMTCQITGAEISNTQVADCIGINWKSSGNNNLWAYDTFTQVTGIDSTFTINIEFEIQQSHT